MGRKLTKPQHRFLEELSSGEHWPEEVLEPATLAMARRLEKRGVIVYTSRHVRRVGLEWGYELTQAGHAKLASQ